jgi:O-antigen/teichoic acid export membrane protein
MVRIGRLIFIILGLIWSGFAVLGQQFIDLWAGSLNSDAYYVALILMSAHLIILTESIGSQFLCAKNEHKEQALLKLGAVVLNIALTAMLIRWNPLFGAAIGAFTSLFVGDILVMNMVYARKLGISLRRYYGGLLKGILPGVLITAGLGLLINLLPIYGWGGLILKIAAMCLVYAAVLWLWGLNEYEKKLVMSLLRLKRK